MYDTPFFLAKIFRFFEFFSFDFQFPRHLPIFITLFVSFELAAATVALDGGVDSILRLSKGTFIEDIHNG